MRYSAQSAAAGSQAGGRVSCAARLIAYGRRALQAAAGVDAAAGGTGSQAAARVRSAAHIQAGIDAVAAQAAQDERAAFGRISERAAIHAAARACHCDSCAVCGGIRLICGVCRQCVKCYGHVSGCTGCKGVPPPVSANELEQAQRTLDRRRAAGEIVRGSSVFSNTFGHFSGEVHAAGSQAAAVAAAQAAVVEGRAARQRLRTMYGKAIADSYPSDDRAARVSG